MSYLGTDQLVVDPKLMSLAALDSSNGLVEQVSANTFSKQVIGANSRLLISDAKFSGIFGEKFTDLGSVTGAVTIDNSLGTHFACTLTGNVQFTFTNPVATGYVCGFLLEITNGGAFTVTWPSVKWPAGFAPTLTAAGVDVVQFTTRDAGTTWRGSLIVKDSR